MFYILHGDDEFSRSEALAGLRERMGDPAMAELNTTHFDGREVSLAELQHACDTIPFFSDRRLVIVDGLLTHLQKRASTEEGKKALQGLVEYLPRMPHTTRLIFAEPRKIEARHPLRRLIARDEALGFEREFRLPQGRELTRWVSQRVREQGGNITSEATDQLVAFVEDDLRLLAQEIEKLLVYVDRSRPITKEDVQLLVSDVRKANIFNMVDALGQRDGETASQLLHRLLEGGDHPLALLGMMTRQIRILIQVKELHQEGLRRRDIAKKLGLHPFVVRKGLAQERNFTMEQLESIHRRLLDTDVAIKRGQVESVLGLDMLIAGLAYR
ncbi:MAG: DNA polymerase III subunit delta [Chloroflexota bacterium]|nr:DNA polymerase III subunit delta [Chloroflexota bacterium]